MKNCHVHGLTLNTRALYARDYRKNRQKKSVPWISNAEIQGMLHKHRQLVILSTSHTLICHCSFTNTKFNFQSTFSSVDSKQARPAFQKQTTSDEFFSSRPDTIQFALESRLGCVWHYSYKITNISRVVQKKLKTLSEEHIKARRDNQFRKPSSSGEIRYIVHSSLHCWKRRSSNSIVIIHQMKLRWSFMTFQTT